MKFFLETVSEMDDSLVVMKTETITAESTEKLNALIDGKTVADARKESLRIAIDAGASAVTLTELLNAVRVSRKPTIVLPSGRFEGLSRGKGWARKGKGENAQWGERVDKGYEVGAGRWSVGSSDGFSRKDATDWSVKNIVVGDQTWTIAN